MTDNWAAFKAEMLADPEVRDAYERRRQAHELARSLMSLRAAAGLTQRQLAKRAGITQPEISRIETAQVDPTWDTVAALLGAMSASVRMRVRKPDGKFASVSIEPKVRTRPRRKKSAPAS